jgi:hypothetical protein
MHPNYRRQLLKHLADIDQQIREAEVLTTVPADDVLLRASKVLADLKEERRKVEAKLRAG